MDKCHRVEVDRSLGQVGVILLRLGVDSDLSHSNGLQQRILTVMTTALRIIHS